MKSTCTATWLFELPLITTCKESPALKSVLANPVVMEADQTFCAVRVKLDPVNRPIPELPLLKALT